MQIACPNCKTSYQIAPAAIGTRGRSVRCVRCQHVWFIPTTTDASAPANTAADSDAAVAAFSAELGTPPLQPDPPPAPAEAPAKSTSTDAAAPKAEPAAVPEAEEPETAALLSDITIPVADAPPLVPAPGEGVPAPGIAVDNGPADVETVAARRARTTGRWRLRMPLPLVIMLLAAVIVGLLGMRKDVVRHVPQLASFYSALGLPVNLRGVAFTDLKIGNEIHDGVPVLVVEGAIVSITSKSVNVPRIRFALRNASGAEIYAWTVQPPQKVLPPFESMPFRSRLAAPPAEGHDVQVRFFTARDAAMSH